MKTPPGPHAMTAQAGAVAQKDCACQRYEGRNCRKCFNPPYPDGNNPPLKVATTPQPSAADDYESWAKQERQREDTATRLGSAVVGAQGDGSGAAMMARLDALTQPTIGEVEVAEIIQNRTGCADSDSIYAAWAVLQALRPAAPAAGKGVDDAMVERAANALRDFHREVGDGAELPHKIAKECAEDMLCAALTRQPVAGDGMVLVPKVLTEAMIEAAIGHDDVEDAWDAMLAAAPAATPTDGGEGYE